MISAARYFTFLLKYLGGIKYTVAGLQNIPKQPAIFAGNHQSAWETVVLNCFLPPCVWIMKKEIFKIPFYGWGVRAMSTIAIDRSRGEDAMSQVIKQGKERFKLGFWIIMFPEGTRIKPKLRKPYKHGCAKLALNLGVPVIPFAHNAGYCLPKNSLWLYPGVVSVVIGAPIYANEGEDATAYTKRIQAWVNHEQELMGS
jgi:1-acyl-sn-glycerol-3-phosphate acyltransferase